MLTDPRPRLGRKQLWLLITLSILTAVAATLLTAHGAEEGLRRAVRLTARTSLALFAVTFGIGAWDRLRPSALSATLRGHRRMLGLTFATSHVIHAALFIRLGTLTPELGREVFAPAMLIAGGSGYFFIALLAVTSHDAVRRWLGERCWRSVHVVGGYWLWLLFVLSVAKRLAQGPLYVVMLAGLLAVAGMRVLARLRKPRRVPDAAGH